MTARPMDMFAGLRAKEANILHTHYQASFWGWGGASTHIIPCLTQGSGIDFCLIDYIAIQPKI